MSGSYRHFEEQPHWVSSKPFGVYCCCCPSPTSGRTSVGDNASRKMFVVLAFVPDSADVGIQGC